MSRPPDFFKNARQAPPTGLDSSGMPVPEAEPRRVNGYLVKPPMRWTKDANGRTLGLNSAAWRRLRKQVLAEEPLCRHCAAQGLTVPATEVDHLRGAADNSRDALQALCKPCHSIKTMAELYGRPARSGCDVDGNPIGSDHPWNKATVGPSGGLADDCQKSPATERQRPTSSPHVNADCLKKRHP